MIARCIELSMKERRHAEESAKQQQEELAIHDPEVARFNYMSIGYGWHDRKWASAQFQLESSPKERHVLRKDESALCWNMEQLG